MAETTVNQSELTAEQQSERAGLALQGTWEIEALTELVLEKLPNDLETKAVRVMLRRVVELNSAMMSALGEDTVPTEELSAVIYA